MHILITGCNGQLGMELQQLSSDYPQHTFHFTDVADLDITKKTEVEKFVVLNRINAIINAAGYTAVDKAEDEPETANLINGTAAGYLAEVATRNNALLVHISTDYVFGGEHFKPLVETDAPKPLSKYAASKLLGEDMVTKHGKAAVILRTSWLYSSFGHNFAKTMLRLGKERDSLNVVFDQVGTPTYAADLAAVILELLPQWSAITSPVLYHYSNEGVASWYDFAVAAHSIATIACQVNPIETKDYPLPARRPFYSVMNKDRIKQRHGIKIPYWRESLERCIRKIERTQ